MQKMTNIMHVLIVPHFLSLEKSGEAKKRLLSIGYDVPIFQEFRLHTGSVLKSKSTI